MSSDYFVVNHGHYATVNDAWLAAVNRMETILDSLDATLMNMADATQGKAYPLWENRQKSWYASYNDMQQRLTEGHAASLDVADIFREGDNRSAQIIAG